MTCEDFLELKRRVVIDFDGVTTAEIAALVKHIRICPSCDQKVKEGSERLNSAPIEHQIAAELIGVRLSQKLIVAEKYDKELQFCTNDPNDGTIYICKDLNCPVHGERNKRF